MLTAEPRASTFRNALKGQTHLGVIAVNVVENSYEDVFRDVMKRHHGDAGLRLQLLALTEVILKKGFEVIAAATEKCLLGRGNTGWCQPPLPPDKAKQHWPGASQETLSELGSNFWSTAPVSHQRVRFYSKSPRTFFSSPTILFFHVCPQKQKRKKSWSV